MVDGVLASCYPFSDHDLAHLSMTPFHYFPNIVEKIFGNGDGFSAYADILEKCGKYLQPYGNAHAMN